MSRLSQGSSREHQPVSHVWRTTDTWSRADRTTPTLVGVQEYRAQSAFSWGRPETGFAGTGGELGRPRSQRSVLQVSNIERVVAFVELADDVLANPWCLRQVEVRLEYKAIDETGRGDWTLHGPTELELKALLIDFRNLVQPSSDQYLPRVIDALASAVPEPDARVAAHDLRVRFDEAVARGTTSENGRPLKPDEVARLWLYGRYHHREPGKARQLKALDPITRFVYRMEFLTYLQNVLGIVVEVCDFITVSKEHGYLATVPLSKGAEPEPPA